MEPFLLYSFPFAILLISLSVFFFKHGSKEPNLPPGSTGWPIVGETLHLAVLGMERYIHYKMKNHPSSDIFKTSLMGENVAVFAGAAGNKFMFSNDVKYLTTWWPDALRRVLTPAEANDNDVKRTSQRGRALLHDILKLDNLKQYIPTIDAMARLHIEKEWVGFEEVKVLPLLKKYTFAATCKLFFSLVDSEDVKKLWDPYSLIGPGLYSLPIDLPGTTRDRAVKAGKMVRERFMEMIKEKKREISEGDFLSRLLRATDEDGESLSDIEVSSNIVGLLLASHDTTSATLTFVLKYLAELPHIYDRVYQEQMEIAKLKGPNEILNWEDIQKMKYSWNVACEVLRIMPPSPGSLREVSTAFTCFGFTIPKGWKTFWTVYSTHKDPKYFLNPEEFDPSRFEGSGPAPFTFVPFGGGPRMCPGKEYARLQILVFMHNVVTKFKWEKLVADEKIVQKITPEPANGLPVRLHPHGRIINM